MIVGIIGDLHAPWVHPMYLRFCQDVFERWRVDRVHFVGDIVDLHSLSFWEKNPHGHGAQGEYDAGLPVVEEWFKTFPRATVCIGNHDERHYRVARKGGMPDVYLKSYAEVWKTPTWKWDFQHTYDNVLYEHGTGSSGKDAALNLAIQKRSSVVIGHIHSWGGVKYHCNPFDRVFGMNAGCGIDCTAYAFEYGKTFPNRPTLGCGVVVNGQHAYFEIMAAGPNEKYHRSRAGRRRPFRKFIRGMLRRKGKVDGSNGRS